MSRSHVGSVAWEQDGGPPLSAVQRFGTLTGMGVVLAGDAAGRLASRRSSPFVDLDDWRPPDTAAVRAAHAFATEVLSPAYAEHSRRCILFSAVAHARSGGSPAVDLEALHVAVMLHDVGLFVPPVAGERCFTVTGAWHARRILRAEGWADDRIESVVTAITANLNPFVPARTFGPLAHVFRVGGLIDVLAQGWKVHPDNLADILDRHPRGALGVETRDLVRAEVTRNPGCRFATFGPVFPRVVARRSFAGSSS